MYTHRAPLCVYELQFGERLEVSVEGGGEVEVEGGGGGTKGRNRLKIIEGRRDTLAIAVSNGLSEINEKDATSVSVGEVWLCTQHFVR